MKKIISGILLIGSLTFAGLIILESPDLPDFVADISTETKTEQNNKTGGAPNYQSPQIPSQPNTTQELVKRVVQELKDEPRLDSINPDELVNQIFEGGIANLDIKSIRPDVELSSLKIISDNSSAAIKNYARDFKNIIARNASYPSIENKDATISDLQLLLFSYKKILPELYQLTVPTSIALLHKEGITVLETQKNILEKLVNAEKDPIAAILAMELIPNVNQEIIAFFQDKLNKL